MYNKVIWHEGMFLKPQHFQQQERYFEHLIDQKIRSAHPFSYGFSELSINNTLLLSGKLAINSCRGIFPDGTVFSIPETTLMPSPLEFTAGSNNLIIYLALPLSKKDISDTKLDATTDHEMTRYCSATFELNDRIIGSNQTCEIQLAHAAVKLLTATDSLNDYTYLAVTEVHEVRNDKKIILNNAFIPPCLELDASPCLKDAANEIQILLENHINTLSQRISDIPQANTTDVIDFISLQLLNRYETLFKLGVSHPQIHPFQLYQWSVQFIKELSGYTHSQKKFKLRDYQHDQLTEIIYDLRNYIRVSLNFMIDRNAFEIPLIKHDYGIWIGEISNKVLLQESTFVLAVYAQTSGETIRTSLPNHIKVAPVEQIQNLVTRALTGIPLLPLPMVPREIPYHQHFIYFTLNKNHEFWDLLATSSGMAFHISGNFPGLKLELWAIKEQP